MTQRRNGLKLKKRLKNQAGFSLAETLLAVLIMLLVSVIVANGIPVARNVYNNVIVGANAQVLLSTTVTALRNELGTAKDIDIKTDNSIVYYKAGIGAYSKLSPGNDADKTSIQLLDYVNPGTGAAIPAPGSTDTRASVNLVTEAASHNASRTTLDVTFGVPRLDTLNGTPDVIIIPDVQVKSASGRGAVIASLNELRIRMISVSG